MRGVFKTIGAYYRVAKPGIVYGNLLTVIAGFLFASGLKFDPLHLLAATGAMALIIAGACVFNNIIDRDIDAKMLRTKDRATATGEIPIFRAIAFGSTLFVLGSGVLVFWTNVVALVVALTGFFFYVVVYGYAKRRTRTHTLIGSIAGAVPILAGYTAATATIDSAGVAIFIAMVLWQMPHFYAIAIYRADQYAAAGIPLLPAAKGIFVTKIVMAAYIAAFAVAACSLVVLGREGALYLAVVLGFSIAWFTRALRGFSATDDAVWARDLFIFSLNVLVAFSLAISFGAYLP